MTKPKPKTIEVGYWLLPLLLSLLQLFVSLASTHRILYEELAESVRNVFWLQHGLIYDGKSSNVGWYATLLLVYKTFGFSLFTAKFVRLVLHLLGLYCAAYVLRRALDVKRAIAPLILIATSPILLYFTTLQTSNGSDIPYAAICLALIMSIQFPALAIVDLAKISLLGAAAMWAAMTYPIFLLYFPSLFFVLLWRIQQTGARFIDRRNALAIGAGLTGFLLPLIATLVALRMPQLLIHDPRTDAGLFRSGGKIGFDLAVFKTSIGIVLTDLFVHGKSYYFELRHSDFTGWFGVIGFVFTSGTALYLCWKMKTARLLLLAAFVLLLINLIAPNLSTAGNQGLRRCTGILTASFVFFAASWNFYTSASFKNIWLGRIGSLLCLLLPLNNLLSFPSLLAAVRAPSDYEAPWFETRETPTASLADAINATAKGAVLVCFGEQQNPQPCRYQEIYAGIAGSRLWNGLDKIDIKALDWNTGQEIVLTPSLWTEYHFPH